MPLAQARECRFTHRSARFAVVCVREVSDRESSQINGLAAARPGHFGHFPDTSRSDVSGKKTLPRNELSRHRTDRTLFRSLATYTRARARARIGGDREKKASDLSDLSGVIVQLFELQRFFALRGPDTSRTHRTHAGSDGGRA